MAKKPPTARQRITDRFIDNVCARLSADKRVRRTLPEGGRLHVDRRLPFLCVYRKPPDRGDPGTEQLVTGEPSFLIAPGRPTYRKEVSQLVRRLAAALAAHFGAFLIVEIWSAADEGPAAPPVEPPEAYDATAPGPPETDPQAPIAMRPAFAIAARGPNKPRSTIEVLQKALLRVKLERRSAEVAVDDRAYARPPGLPLLVPAAEAQRIGCHAVGLVVHPVYRDPATGALFPAALRRLRRGLGRALKQAFYAYARTHTSIRPEHYYALGRRAMVKAVWEVDRRLAEISDSFDFLLQVTPVNAWAAWRQFKRGLFRKAPEFQLRPLAVEPVQWKRQLYEIPVERIEDPTLAQLFRQKQDELDRKITMLSDVGTRRFLPGSLQVYGGVEPSLLALANELLSVISPHARDESKGRQLDAAALARRAEAEIEHYRQGYPDFQARVTIRDDMYWGMLVSGGELLIGRQTKVPGARVEALLAHEVGTHLLTYFNGRAQPFRQLYSGLAGYDGLQEGLAVLAEHLTGGLSRPRLRLLAARVLAVHHLVQGEPFVETFRLLWEAHEFPQRTAYTVTMRVYRGGGLTKDAVYLRGLAGIIDYLREGGQLEPLLVGKIAAEHIPLVKELRLRQILRAPPLRPRYLDSPRAADKLNRLRQGLTVPQLMEGPRK